MNKKLKINLSLPLLPLRDIVVFPGMITPLFVGRDKSIKALEAVMDKDKRIFIVTQKNPEDDDPSTDQIYDIGCLGKVVQLLKLPDGTVKVLIEAKEKAQIVKYYRQDTFFNVEIRIINEPKTIKSKNINALSRRVTSRFDDYVKLNPIIPAEATSSVSNIKNPEQLVNTISSYLILKIEEINNIGIRKT